MLTQSLSHLLLNMRVTHPSSYRLYPKYQTSTPESIIYSASALVSVGATSASFASAGAALVSTAAGSASDEVQRV
jgi:hypothetical protein